MSAIKIGVITGQEVDQLQVAEVELSQPFQSATQRRWIQLQTDRAQRSRISFGNEGMIACAL